MKYEYEILTVDVNEALEMIEKIKSSHQLGDDVKIKTTVNPF